MSPVELLERLSVLDADAAGPGEVAAALGHVRVLRGWLDAREAVLARRQNALSVSTGAAPPADVLGRAGKTSRRTAERVERRAATLGDAPSLESMLAAGKVSGEHADALGAEAARVNDTVRAELFGVQDELAVAAASMTPEQFRRYVRRTADALSDDDGVAESERQRDRAQVTLGINDATGMGELRGELHPDDWQKVNRRIDAEIAALRKLDLHRNKTRAQLGAVALVHLITGNRAAGRVPAEVVIHVPLDVINAVPGAPRFGEYSNGAPVPVETIRRHACDANIIPVVLAGDSLPLDVGRARRLATPAQRTALRAMYNTCAVDECNTSFDRCEMHHILEWTQHRGPTDLKFLIPACGYHHHRFHEGRWRLELDPTTRQLAIYYPDGTLHSISHPDNWTNAA